jgi:ubiquinone/menaquinone biosynthesis C-methylase UbiE
MLEYTGERMVPESTDGPTFYEHVERYRFSLPHVRGRRVLDIACGEGYGTAAIRAAGAASVIGVDIAVDACAHAAEKYGITTRVGSAEQMPVTDGEVDLIVSFETIEHLHNVPAFIRECHRVLSPGGQIIISTPNLPVYRGIAPSNPFHHHEMTKAEFHDRLSKYFTGIQFFGQRIPLPKVLKLRGVRRLPTAYYRAVAPYMVDPLSQSERDNVISLIARPSAPQDRFDPCAVREMSAAKLNKATYLIAIATRSEENF